MTPEQKVRHLILIKAAELGDRDDADVRALGADEIDHLYGDPVDHDALLDAESEMREGEVETDIPCDWSRHFESRSVAARYIDGTWVGWTYWFGGGKHAEPEAIGWIDDAYDLAVAEEEKLVTVCTFSKVSPPAARAAVDTLAQDLPI